MHRIRAEQVHSDCRTPVRTVYRLPAFDDAGMRRRVGRILEFRPRTSPPPGRRRSAFPLVVGWEHISPARAFPELRQADHSCSWSTPTRRNANCAGPLCRPIAACDLGGRGAEQGPPAAQAARGKLCTTGSLLALVWPAPRVVPVGRILNLTLLSLPKTCGVRGVEAGGKAIKGM